MKSLIYIVSSGHSGSTALGSVLGAEASVSMLGEVTSFFGKANKTCSCSLPSSHCPLWGSLARERNRWSTPTRWGKTRINHTSFFQLASELCGSDSIVDSSKTVRRLRVLQRDGLPLKVLFLQRNGFETVLSKLLKAGADFTGSQARVQMELWAGEQRLIRNFLSSERPPYLRVEHGRLDPGNSEMWAGIYEFLGLPVSEPARRVDLTEQHQIDGNAIRKSGILEYRPKDSAVDAEHLISAVLSPREWPQEFRREISRFED